MHLLDIDDMDVVNIDGFFITTPPQVQVRELKNHIVYQSCGPGTPRFDTVNFELVVNRKILDDDEEIRIEEYMDGCPRIHIYVRDLFDVNIHINTSLITSRAVVARVSEFTTARQLERIILMQITEEMADGVHEVAPTLKLHGNVLRPGATMKELGVLNSLRNLLLPGIDLPENGIQPTPEVSKFYFTDAH